MSTDILVNTKRAGEILGISPSTLKKLRSRPDTSPLPPIPYRKYSSRCIRYSLADLERWKEENGIRGGAAV